MPLEIELKLKFDSHDEVRARLAALHAEHRGTVREANIFFDRPDRSLRRAVILVSLRTTVAATVKPEGNNRMATTLTSSTNDFVAQCTAMASDLLRLPARHVWVDYDQEADVLYLSFRKPQHATKTIELQDDILLRKNGRTIVGLTIMNASTRHGRVKPNGKAHAAQ